MAGGERRKGLCDIQVNACLFGLCHTFIQAVLTLERAWTCVDVCEGERGFGRSPCPCVLLCSACQRAEPDALSDDDREPKAL